MSEGTENIDAYLKLMKGINLYRHFNKEDNFLAQKIFEEVVALDPEFSRGHVYLGLTHLMDSRFRWSKAPDESLNRAEEFAKRALELGDPSAGYMLLGTIYRTRGL